MTYNVFSGTLNPTQSINQSQFPVAMASVFPRLLSTSVSIGRPQKQPNVTLIFPIEKSRDAAYR